MRRGGWMIVMVLGACSTSTDGATGDDFIDSIPDASLLEITLDDETDAALSDSFAQTATPHDFWAKAEEVRDEVKSSLEDVHARIQAAIDGVEPTTFTEEGRECRQYVWDGELASWKLTNCRESESERRFGFQLEGRELTATGDEDYNVVMRGRGAVLPAFEGRVRGQGRVYFDLDQAFALRGEGAQGEIAVAYRASGRARQLEIALRDFFPEGAEETRTERFSFKRARGQGGHLVFGGYGDYVTEGTDNSIVRGQDGLDEYARVSLSWRTAQAARVAATVCDGTVGVGACVRVVECFEGSVVTAETVDASIDAEIMWNEASCPAVTFDGRRAPERDGERPTRSGDNSDVGGPSVTEPEALPDLE